MPPISYYLAELMTLVKMTLVESKHNTVGLSATRNLIDCDWKIARLLTLNQC